MRNLSFQRAFALNYAALIIANWFEKASVFFGHLFLKRRGRRDWQAGKKR